MGAIRVLLKVCSHLTTLRLALVGVVVGAAVGAGTGMWWTMGVLGGTFPGVARRFARK